jgi:hypothetical protein
MSKTRNLGNLTDVLSAGSTYATATTPLQFDNSTNLATTAFSQIRGIQSSGITQVTSSGTIPLSAVGGMVLGNTAASTQTLPAISSVPMGAQIHFFTSVAMTVFPNGADLINTNGSTVSSIVLNGGDTATLEASTLLGTNQWFVVGGSVNLKYAASFGASIAISGYQKLPSGIIIQWGSATANSSGIASFTLPIAFPNAILIANCNYLTAANAMGNVATISSSSTRTVLQGNSFVSSTAAAISGAVVYFIATGY